MPPANTADPIVLALIDADRLLALMDDCDRRADPDAVTRLRARIRHLLDYLHDHPLAHHYVAPEEIDPRD